MDLQESYSNDFISQDQPDESVKYHKPGAAITSMVLGICSVSLWFYPFVTSIPCIIMGFIAIHLAKKEEGQVSPKCNGFLKAGRITGIIGVIISIVFTVLWTALIAFGIAYNR